ncbi:hypothetical protein LUZ60_006353 [Juncus effusus]|nr:hypothetical protein LUZ60_006353 [Juncus effusus]
MIPILLHIENAEYYRVLIDNRTAIVKKAPQTPKPNEKEEEIFMDPEGSEIQKMINKVKTMLNSMNDGEITISAYDTAWVAMIKDINGGKGPQFPSSIDWIVSNQLPDGSWGDTDIFSAHDRMINTLACVIALTTWRINPKRCKRGLVFIRENMWRLAEEEDERMPIGFEVAFPSLIQMAKDLELDVPFDYHALHDINTKRDIKLMRIPKDVLHKVPTTLLHTLEGMPDLDWESLLKLQCEDGSFLFSPSATAYAFISTRDAKCLDYLERIVNRFHGGVPNVYPVDLFEHMWAVDRLERLGLSRYFGNEINTLLDYAYRYWTKDGICWARNTKVHDVDDTSMGFRLLRLHGFDVSPCVFRHFEKEGEFCCFAGQSNQAVTGMYNLNRASQIMFPDEDILNRAKNFSHGFLQEKRNSGQLRDKWIISKDLPGEVKYALDFPWYASLPRVETRLYLEQYGGSSDVWIGKTLYRMPLVSNDLYLELAKKDFNRCQVIHQLEWSSLQRWYDELGLERIGMRRKDVLKAYFLAVASIFEPERAAERLAWARTSVLADAISLFSVNGSFMEQSLKELNVVGKETRLCSDSFRIRGQNNREEGLELLIRAFKRTVEIISYESASLPANWGRQDSICHHLSQTWNKWLSKWRVEKEEKESEFGSNEISSDTALLLVRTIEICAGQFDLKELLIDSQEFAQITHLVSSICQKLRRKMLISQGEGEELTKIERELQKEMEEITQFVLQNPNFHKFSTKQTILCVVKSFYYLAHCPSETIDEHISMVIFDKAV